MKYRFKNNRSRTESAVSKTVKAIMSRAQIEHLDAFSKLHKHDVEHTRKWMAYFAGRNQVKKLSNEQVDEVLRTCGLGSISDKSTLLFREVEQLISLGSDFDIRGNLCFENCKWVEKQGSEWLAFIANIRREESEYKESGGTTLRKSDPIPSKPNTEGLSKDEKRRVMKRYTSIKKYQDPLEVMYVRSPPWWAMNLENADAAWIKEKICEFAKIFEITTGYPVKAVNIHRENSHDVHLHIVYSTVVYHQIPFPKNKAKDIERKLKAEIRAKRAQENLRRVENGLTKLPMTNPAIHKEYLAQGLDRNIPDFDGGEYRKIIKHSRTESNKRLKDWPKARRAMHVLGAAYRYKGRIWHAANNNKDKEAVRLFREQETIEGGETFSQRVVDVFDQIDNLYVDWWAESLFEELLLGGLEDEVKAKVATDKKECVEKYIKTGSVLSHPAQIMIADQKEELKQKQKALDRERDELRKLKAQAASQISVNTASEADIRKRELIVAGKERNLNQREDSLDSRELKILERELDTAGTEQAQENREAAISEREMSDSIMDEKLRAEGRNEVLSEVSQSLDKNNIAAKSTTELLERIESNSNEARNAGKNDVITSIAAFTHPDATKPVTLDKILKKFKFMVDQSELMKKFIERVQGLIIEVDKGGIPTRIHSACNAVKAMIQGKERE